MAEFDLLSDTTVAAPKEFDLHSDTVVAPPKEFDLHSDTLVLPASAFALTSDTVVGSNTHTIRKTIYLTSDTMVVGAEGETGRGQVSKAPACPNKITCDCPELPLENLSSEDLDVPVFCATVTVREDPVLGQCATETVCTRFCCSDESQLDAYLCALREAQECVWGGWGDDTCPPPGDIPPDCPPICPPSQCPPFCGPPPPTTVFFPNDAQTCVIHCADGSSFQWTVPFGTVVGLTKIQANANAHNLACRLAKQKKICFETDELDDGCINEDYTAQIIAHGGKPFVYPFFDDNPFISPSECFGDGLPNGTIVPYRYQIIAGTLPTGLTLGCQGYITGTPTVAGDFTFTVQINDANNLIQSKEFTLTIENCAGTDYGNIEPTIFSNTRSYWNSGMDLPAGHYRITYIEGAWRPGPLPKWVVGDGGGVPPRGYVIVYSHGTQVDFPTTGIYNSQAEAEAATAGTSIVISHTGGVIGMFLRDSPYTDNSAGSPNPTFQLEAM